MPVPMNGKSHQIETGREGCDLGLEPRPPGVRVHRGQRESLIALGNSPLQRSVISTSLGPNCSPQTWVSSLVANSWELRAWVQFLLLGKGAALAENCSRSGPHQW